MLQDYLSKFSEPCPSCEYDLHNLKGNRCPECGQELLVRVGLAAPNLVAFVVGLVGLASAVGFSGFLLVYIVYVLLIAGRGTSIGIDEVIVLGAEFFCSGTLVVIWSRANRWVRRRSRRTRWTLALACWILPVLGLILFIAAIA